MKRIIQVLRVDFLFCGCRMFLGVSSSWTFPTSTTQFYSCSPAYHFCLPDFVSFFVSLSLSICLFLFVCLSIIPVLRVDFLFCGCSMFLGVSSSWTFPTSTTQFYSCSLAYHFCLPDFVSFFVSLSLCICLFLSVCLSSLSFVLIFSSVDAASFLG